MPGRSRAFDVGDRLLRVPLGLVRGADPDDPWGADVAITGEHQNAFTEWVRRSDELEAAYERRFGEPLVMTEANAGLEWIKRFLENDPIIMTSDTRLSEAVGARGQESPPFGMFYVYSKHRDVPLQDLALLD